LADQQNEMLLEHCYHSTMCYYQPS